MSQFPEIPGYRIVKKLGQGGMADVYEAVQENLDRKVAVKVIIPELFRDASFAARFVKEAQTAARLSHPHVLHIYDVGAAANCHYIVMECLQESLKERLKNGPLAPAAALSVLRRMAEALDYAHTKGFVHRDIKPDNILFREDGAAVLTDFGIAKAVDSQTKLTRTGMSVGTPHYMSPEQIRGFDLDGRADFYSLGIVFYEMLAGKVPFDATDTIAVCMKHVQDPVPVLPASLSRFQPLLEKMLAKDREERLSSGKDLGEIADAAPEKARESRPARAPERKEYAPAPKRETPRTAERKVEPVVAQAAGKRFLVPVLVTLLVVLVAVLFSILGRKPAPAPVAQALPLETGAGDITDERPPDLGVNKQPPMLPSGSAAVEKEPDIDLKPKKPAVVQVEPAVEPKKEKPADLPRIGLLDLDPQRAQEYAEKLQRVSVERPPPGVNAYGQISLQASVDGRGRISVLEFDDQGLTVEPAGSGPEARAAIRRGLAGVALPPPRDRSLTPAILASWRLNFKVASFGGKWILSKQ